jgi:hypothetical protein
MMSCGVEEPSRQRHPLWRWRDHALVFLGEWRERLVFCDERGALWRYHGEAGDLAVVAASPSAFLEQIALEEQLFRDVGHTAPVRVFTDAGPDVARRLGLSILAEASDALVQTYEADGLWLWQGVEYGPNRTELRLVGEDIPRIVEAVKVARALAPGVKVKVWGMTRQAAARVDALVAAGVGDRFGLSATAAAEAALADSEDDA